MGVVRVTKTAVADGNYTNGDVISESKTAGTAFAFKVPNRAGKGVTVKYASLACDADAFTATCTLHLFSENPASSQKNDNEAFALDDDDFDTYLASIVFDALVDKGEACFIDKQGLSIPAAPTGGDNKIYGILEVVTTDTDEAAGMRVSVALGYEEVQTQPA